ncbi:MAG TPA: hypothetical protein VEA99_18240 [Gemmatimonadaceae bacterium]|nr:hypothetical protein [Gemmatimonadaceae bacterium]
MASREFTDSEGRSWNVWNTIPVVAMRSMPADHADGWLTFECGDQLRRLAPVPEGWESASTERLELMCRAAQEVQRRTGPFARIPRPEPDGTSELTGA